MVEKRDFGGKSHLLVLITFLVQKNHVFPRTLDITELSGPVKTGLELMTFKLPNLQRIYIIFCE